MLGVAFLQAYLTLPIPIYGTIWLLVVAFTASFLRNLPPQQRLTLLLVYGERFDTIDAGRVLDVPSETIGARLVRISASLADRLSADEQIPTSATVETLYPGGPRA